jgi:hypothetical protein
MSIHVPERSDVRALERSLRDRTEDDCDRGTCGHDFAEGGIAQARKRGRLKYEVLGLQTHAHAMAALGCTIEAVQNYELQSVSHALLDQPALGTSDLIRKWNVRL